MKNILFLIISLFLFSRSFCESRLVSTNVSVMGINVTQKHDNSLVKNFVVLFINSKDTISWQCGGIKNLMLMSDSKMFVKTDSVEFVIENIFKYMNHNRASYNISIAIGETETDLSEIEYMNKKGVPIFDIYSPEHDSKMMNTIKIETVK